MQATHRDERDLATVARVRVDVIEGPDQGRSSEVDGTRPLAIGTAPDNDLVLTDPRVSRYHVELVRADRGIAVRDLSSLNGTWFGELSIERARVAVNTRIRVGGSTLAILDGATVERETAPIALRVPGFVGASDAARTVAAQLATIAPSNASVLLSGETGTGKEVAARAIHALSARAEGPFVVVDCGSLPPTLIASELFGHERGAFTGADRRRVGAFEKADGGTIFLDEIGELPLSVQPALLAPLERRRIQRVGVDGELGVGGDGELGVDVRVIAATNRDLRGDVNQGTFRADLYYRLAVARVTLPPLRERPGDVRVLIRHFVRELTGRGDAPVFDEATLIALEKHPFHGNIRELRNVVEAALAVGAVELESDGTNAPEPERASTVGALPPYQEARAEALERFQRQYCARLVDQCGSNASAASRLAQMDRNYLVGLFKKYGLR